MDRWTVKPEDIDGKYHKYYGRHTKRIHGNDRKIMIEFRARYE